jgi:hypothetical protein
MHVTLATPADFLFIRDLQRRFTNQIGFFPSAATERELQRNNILLSTLNDDNAGFLLIRPALSCQPTTTTIIQAAVRMDAQRQAVGLALIARAATDAIARGQTILQASCRQSLEANLFWPAAGFVAVATRRGGNAHHDTIIIWRRPLSQGIDITNLPTDAYARAPGGKFTTRDKTSILIATTAMPPSLS